MWRLSLVAAVACISPASRPIENHSGTPSPPPPPAEPMLGERGFRGHPDGGVPTKQEVEAWLPGSKANVSERAIVVELSGVPQSKLVYESVPADIAMLVTEDGRIVDVFAREVTMSHGLEVGMTLAEAKQRHPTLACNSAMGETTCALPGSHFSLRIFESPVIPARIDYITWVRP